MIPVKLLLLFLALTILNACSSRFNNDDHSPNVILILVDDLGWTDLGCFGSDFYQTPNIDRLADDGVKFTNSYSSCTVCSPSRSSIMTGKYPARLHLTDWIEGHRYPWAKLKVPDWKMYLDSNELTLGEAFKQADYFTAHVGKWHLGEKEKDWPENHGFDVNIAGWKKGMPNISKNKEHNGYFPPYGNPRLTDGPEGEYLTERLTAEVCHIIEDHSESPFFINFCLYNVHTPLQAKEEKIEKYRLIVDSAKIHKNPVYAAMVEHTDDAIGTIINKLKDEGLYQNTIILFSSDNGGLIGRHPQVTNNHPLRAGKGNIYEGGVRVPTILHVPTINIAVNEIHEPVISPDYYTTLLDLAGIDPPLKNNADLDGVSWKPLLTGNDSFQREAIYWHYPHYHTEGAVPYGAIRLGDWKLIENFETKKYELYHLEQDISESQNLINKHPEKANELKFKLENWRKEVNAQLPSVNKNYVEENARKKR